MALNKVTKRPVEFLLSCMQCLTPLDGHPLAPININENTALLDCITSPQNMASWANMKCTFNGKGRLGAGAFPKLYVV